MTERELTLREISDRVSIQDLLVRYATAIDNEDYTLLDSCFTDDAILDYSAVGGPGGNYAEARQWLQDSLCHLEASQHRIGNIVYEFTGDSASTKTMYTNPNSIKQPDGTVQVFTVGGYYLDELVFEDEGWKIRKRVDIATYVDGQLPSRESIVSEKDNPSTE